MSKRVLCVWLPNWPVQRALAETPLPDDRPLVLSTRDPRRGWVVAACNRAARQQGIAAGIRTSEAAATGDVEIREYTPDDDLDHLCELAELAQQFSPIVGLEQLDRYRWAGRSLHQPEAILLDVTGIGAVFGGEPGLVQQMGQWLQRRRYYGRMAIAGTVGAAWAIAACGRAMPPALPLAGTASDSPAGSTPSDRSADTGAEERPSKIPASRCCIVPPGGEAEAVMHLSCSALRISLDHSQTLQRLGLHTIASVMDLPRAGLATRFGNALLQRLDQATGRLPEPIVVVGGHPDWCLERILEYPIQDRASVEELVRGLVMELAHRLGSRGEGALRLTCRIDFTQPPPLLLQIGLFRPTQEPQHLQNLVLGQLESHLDRHSMLEIWRVGLQATLTAPLRWKQTMLFDQQESAYRHEVGRLVDVLSGRLGRKRVMRSSTHREAQPESAFRLAPLTGRRPDGRPQNTVHKLGARWAAHRAEPSTADPLRRPTHLLPRPEPIRVVWGGPPQATPPHRFCYQGRWRTVVEAIGPERLESGWWRGPSQRREYYRAADSQGDWFWIFRDLRTNEWFLHGWFD